MGYRAAVDFFDLKDGNHLYHAGESFPRNGLAVSEERIAELATDKNRMGYPLIVGEVEEVKEPEKKPAKTARKRVKKDACGNL